VKVEHRFHTAEVECSAEPHSLEAERSVLGAILIDNDTYNVAAAVLGAKAFFRDAHQRIFRRMADMAARRKPIDLVTLKEGLERAGELDEVGGSAYIASLVDGVPHSTNVEYYAQIVGDHARQRDLLAVLRRSIEAVGTDADVEDLADRIAVDCRAIGGGRRLPDSDRIEAEMERESARREARRRLDAAERGVTETPALEALSDVLARPVPAIQYRIDGWLPVDARVILAAAAKSGKTTMIGSLVRSLVDGDAWLDAARARPIRGRLALLDLEMSAGQLGAWLRAQEIRHTDRVLVASLRGRASSLDLLDSRVRRDWAARLRAADVQYLIIDPLRPVLDAIGLNEHTEAGRYLAAIDALLVEAGISEACIVHHMGHTGERSRGDSRLRDWPDVEWRIVREDTTNAASPRYLAAFGRGVDMSETRLGYDPVRRRLSVAGGSRRDGRLDAALGAVVDALSATTAPLSGRAIKSSLTDSEYPRDVLDAALRHGLRTGCLIVEDGPRRARNYRLSDRVSGSVRPVSPDTISECPAASIEADTRTLDQLDLVSGGYRV